MEIGKYVVNFWCKYCAILLIIFSLVIFFIFVWYFFNPIYKIIGCRFQLPPNQPSKWEVIKSLAYLVGLIFLGFQISISNRRATAAEETAKAQLQSNRETRYNNAMENLLKDKPLASISAIYNLYHISQGSNEYDSTIFDIFIEKLRTLCPKDADVKNASEWKRTKQLIVNKLFIEKDGSRVYEKNDLKIDLAKLDLSGIDFTGAKLANADLGDSNCDNTLFRKANLTNAKIPANLSGCKNMNNVILDKVKAGSANFQGLQLEGASLKDIEFNHVNLEKANLKNANLERAVLKGCILKEANLTGANLIEADLTGADLTGAEGLIFDQLIMVKCLHQTTGLESSLHKKLNEKKPKLFVSNTS